MTLDVRNNSGENCVLMINGRQISNYSEYVPAIYITRINDKFNERYQIKVSLFIGSDDSSFLSELYDDTDAEISVTYSTRLEKVSLTECVSLSKGGLKLWNEEVFTFEFGNGVKTLSASI